jgi:hypothetical protein
VNSPDAQSPPNAVSHEALQRAEQHIEAEEGAANSCAAGRRGSSA